MLVDPLLGMLVPQYACSIGLSIEVGGFPTFGQMVGKNRLRVKQWKSGLDPSIHKMEFTMRHRQSTARCLMGLLSNAFWFVIR